MKKASAGRTENGSEEETKLMPASAAKETSSITVRLSAAASERLQKQTQSGHWTPDAVLEELIREGLHEAFPAIRYRGVLIAEAGLFRSFDRRSQRPALLMKSTLGSYRITPRDTNEEYQRWMGVYARKGVVDSVEKASEMCAFSLKEELQKVNEGDEAHVIYPEDFLVEQFV
jgi:hypothetical protein